MSGAAGRRCPPVHHIAAPLIDIGLRTHEILENALEFQLARRNATSSWPPAVS